MLPNPVQQVLLISKQWVNAALPAMEYLAVMDGSFLGLACVLLPQILGREQAMLRRLVHLAGVVCHSTHPPKEPVRADLASATQREARLLVSKLLYDLSCCFCFFKFK